MKLELLLECILVAEARGIDKVHEAARWAHINVKLLHYFFSSLFFYSLLFFTS